MPAASDIGVWVRPLNKSMLFGCVFKGRHGLQQGQGHTAPFAVHKESGLLNSVLNGGCVFIFQNICFMKIAHFLL